MKSWEVLREAADKVGAKMLAAKLNLSTALIYKWCSESPKGDPDGSGARNPLDRLREIYEVTGDDRVINWLCHHAGGFFTPNPRVLPHEREEHLLNSTQRMVHEFGNLLGEVSRSIENDGRIMPNEADRIRQVWEQLKQRAECFVVACEQGLYGTPPEQAKQ